MSKKCLSGKHECLFSSPTQHQTVGAVFFGCIEPRHESLRAYYRKTFCLTGSDVYTPPGGVLDLVTPGPAREVDLKRILLCVAAHQATEVILMNHLDCAAYKDAGHVFDSRKEEIAQHEADLSKAETLLRDHLDRNGYQHVDIKTRLADSDGVLM